MPSRLAPAQPDRIAREQRLARARLNTPLQTFRAQAPWHGYIPDLDGSQVGPNACSEMNNLIARANPAGLGEVLRQPPGFFEIDPTYATSGTELGDSAGTSNTVLMLGFFPRTSSAGARSGEKDLTLMAVTGGNGTDEKSGQLWRIKPSTGVWDEILHNDGEESVGLKGNYVATSGTSKLYDWAVMAAGASPRADTDNTAINEPVFVFCSGNDLDAVMVYADDGGESGTYENLTEAFGKTTAAFRARSVEAWGDRLNFLNTFEDAVHHRQRLRRTSIGSADPDTANAGSGAIDFREFSGDGLRVESLGNLLACYFEDGVAVVRRSGNSVAPYEKQILTTQRGLLSTFSMANLGGGRHFGIFTDGWYILDSSGRFTEVGLADVGGVPTQKWTQTFFNRLDVDKRDRIYCHYDTLNQWVYITLPLDGKDNNTEVWIYDVRGDRIFTQDLAVTCYASSNEALTTGPTIGALTGTIGDLAGTIGSYTSSFGIQSTLHGTTGGLVMLHDPALTTQINTDTRNADEMTYQYKTTLSSLGNPRTIKRAREIFLEHIKSGTTNPVVTIAASSPSGGTETGTLNNTVGSMGDVVTLTRGFNFSGTSLSLQIAGTGPFQIRSVEADVLDYGVRPRP